MNRIFQVFLFCFCLSGLSACQVSAVQQAIATQFQVSLLVLDREGKSLLIRDGARFTLYKDQRILQEVRVEDNELRLQHPQEPPPYTYTLQHLFVEGYETDKGVPIDTQGGLISAGPPVVLPLPAELVLPSASPGRQTSGKIESDLRTQSDVFTLRLQWPYALEASN